MKRTITVAILIAALPAAGMATAFALSPAPHHTPVVAPALELTAMGEGRGFMRGRRGQRAMMRFLREADANNNGEITQAEIDTFIAEKVSLGDANGDGALTLEEFQAVWADLSRQAMVRAFQRLDADGSATIATAELDERFGSLVERLDRNDDGVLSREDRRGRGWRRNRDDR
ncbi:MAG: hypothetical protein AAGF45_05315 [Pseudomonadota bacterium]